MAVFAVVGSAFLVRSFATTNPNSKVSEAESYAIAQDTTIVSDTAASGTNFVQFDASTVVAPGSFCSSFPSLPSTKPDSTTTGVPSGTSLSTSGTITITTAGTVIDAKNVTGSIVVMADNVTIKNTKIQSTGYYGIEIRSGYAGAKVINSEIFAPDPGNYIGIAADGTDSIICGNYIHGFQNGITLTGIHNILQANDIEKLEDVGDPHYDAVEVYGGNGHKLWGNHLRNTKPDGTWLGDTGAINLTAYDGNIDDVEINGNWIGGGGYTLYVAEQFTSHASNVRVTNNKWYRNSYQWGTHTLVNAAVTTWSNNTFEDNGQAIAQ